jgi:hypothetical protein
LWLSTVSVELLGGVSSLSVVIRLRVCLCVTDGQRERCQRQLFVFIVFMLALRFAMAAFCKKAALF